MRLDEPSWWYEPEASHRWIVRALLPAARAYAGAVERRLRAAEPYHARIPVICVGNFTAGGTGKTPLARLVAEEVTRLGVKPVFLTRGYGGRVRGPKWLDEGTDTAATVGDESLLLARTAPVMIARDRALGARTVEISAPEVGAIVMDDGLQNPHLKKDLTLAVVDAARGFGNGHVLPAGPLRADLDVQLGLVDAIIVNGVTSNPKVDSQVFESLRRRFAGPVLAARTEPIAPVDWMRGLRVLAYAGIGNPNRFFSLLESLDAEVADRVRFADHHNLTEREARSLLAAAEAGRMTLVTTEKDLVRLAGLSGARAELASRSRTLAIRIAFGQRDDERFTGLLKDAISAARGNGKARGSA